MHIALYMCSQKKEKSMTCKESEEKEAVQVRLNSIDYQKLCSLAEQLGTNKPSVFRLLLRKCKRLDVVAEWK